MGVSCLIGRTEIEKSDGIPKPVDGPSKPCGEKLSRGITGDESWFAYSIESDAMFASSPAEMIPKFRASILCKKL
jgi:hypothetical protein